GGPMVRPAKYWRLTRDADRLFPDAYAELSVALIGAIGDAYGPAGVQRVLDSRCRGQPTVYRALLSGSPSLGDKLRGLAKQRTEEGYMAEVRRDGDGFLFIENHCPICAAATVCQGFCSTELELFRDVLGPEVAVECGGHIVSEDR